MDPVRSSLGGGVAGTGVLTILLLVGDVLLGGYDFFLFATVENLCAVGPPLCLAGGTTATLLTYLVYVVLFAIAWPLFFAGFTWGLPGESGVTHGLVFALVLWTGYATTVVYQIELADLTLVDGFPLLLGTLLAYLGYGLVLGGVYDRLAEHRTFTTAG
ncbi:DUF6789 family protein [Halomicrococcus gelatinilyticus]|uniref:DUF6789 family protein n=1 Tax=Halomicrococcus gelatinilyticus TaxID=1702103 RepID=UPI002E0E1369